MVHSQLSDTPTNSTRRGLSSASLGRSIFSSTYLTQKARTIWKGLFDLLGARLLRLRGGGLWVMTSDFLPS